MLKLISGPREMIGVYGIPVTFFAAGIRTHYRAHAPEYGHRGYAARGWKMKFVPTQEWFIRYTYAARGDL